MRIWETEGVGIQEERPKPGNWPALCREESKII